MKPKITLTDNACGAMCWTAKEKICRCSCGGKNHGISLKKGKKLPLRQSKMKGIIYSLVTVGNYIDLYEKAKQIKTGRWIKKATLQQINSWQELKHYKKSLDNWIKIDYHLPYLLWKKNI